MAKPQSKSGPSFLAIPLEVMWIPVDQLSFGAKCLYGRLRLYAHLLPEATANERQRHPCYPAESTLARDLGVGDRQIRKLKKELRERGLISWKRTGGSNRYEIFHPGKFIPKG